METQPRSWLMMRWVRQGPGTHQLPSSMEKVCRPILPYPMTILMHINLPYFHLLVIPLSIFLSSPFPSCLCPPSCLPPQFLMTICLFLNAGLVSDFCGLPSSLVPPCYYYCLCPSCYLVFLGLRLTMKLEFPLMFCFLPWLFV